MITIIHGTNISTSRTHFFEQKKQFPDAVFLSGENLTITDLVQIFDGGGLFNDHKTVFIEQFFKNKRKRTVFKTLTEYLIKAGETHTIFLWENKELPKADLGIIKGAIPKIFNLPQTLFLFLDALKPNNGKQLITLFHQTIETTDDDMVFSMLVRQVRLLLAIKSPQSEIQIEELKRMAPWQKSKLQKQASLFTQEQLIHLYQQIFEIEIAQKTGNLSLSLVSAIDFLLLEI